MLYCIWNNIADSGKGYFPPSYVTMHALHTATSRLLRWKLPSMVTLEPNVEPQGQEKCSSTEETTVAK